MKVKNNTKNLIPRYLKSGGFIFKLSRGHSANRRAMQRQNRRISGSKTLTNRNVTTYKGSPTVATTAEKRLATNSARVAEREAAKKAARKAFVKEASKVAGKTVLAGALATGAAKVLSFPVQAALTPADVADATMPKNEQGLPRDLAMPLNTKTSPTWKTTPKGTKYLDYGDGTFSLAGSNKRYHYADYLNKPVTQDTFTETQSKPVGTQDSGTKNNTRSGSTRGNTRTTVKPATTTFTESPTNITDQSWLDARNAAMQRGWGTYNYNGLTYQFTGDELKLAVNNWRNRRKAGYQAEGILDLNPPAEITAMIPRGDGEVKPEDAIVEKNTPIDSKTTPYTFWYQLQLTNNPNLTRDMLWQATQDVRNGNRDASYYGESSDLVSQLANANQDSAKNYIYNLWNTNNDVATQAGRKNYTESQGLTFGEPTATFNWLNDIQEFLNKNKRFSKAKQGTKLIRRK